MTVSRVATLVSAQWLKQRLSASAATAKHATKTTAASEDKGTGTHSPLRVLDTSWMPEPHVNGYKEFYKAGHIPGAFYLDLKKLSTKRPDSPIDCPIPDSNLFQEYVESLGITNSTHVVAYDRLNTRPSVRAWFLFRLFGHHQVSILNGGMAQWEKEGFQITTEEPSVEEKSTFKVNFRPELLVDLKTMLSIVSDGKTEIVDTRPDEGGFYISNDDTSGGHMPDAKSIPFPEFFKDDKTFKSENELAQLFSNAGVDLTKPVVATCQRGMTACAAAVAAHLLGKEDVPVYNGSWFEWSALAPDNKILKEKKK